MALTLNLVPESVTVATYSLSAKAGLIDIKSDGLESTLGLCAETVTITGFSGVPPVPPLPPLPPLPPPIAILTLAQRETGALIDLSAKGEAPGITLKSTATNGKMSTIAVDHLGINITSIFGGLLGSISIKPAEMTLSIGPADDGAAILLTPKSITFKVGKTTMALTPLGIVTSAPAVAIKCDDLVEKVGDGVIREVSGEGIVEIVGEVTREVTAEGHLFTAAEVVVNVGVAGLDTEGATKTSEVEGPSVLDTSLLTVVVEADLSITTPITTVE